jgi:hypothetical protein
MRVISSQRRNIDIKTLKHAILLLILLQSIKTITGESYSAQPIQYKRPLVAAERIVVHTGIVQLRDGMKQRQLTENGEPNSIASRRPEMDGLG